MHHKFCVIDEALCLFGSFNWTKNAETQNIENLTVSDDSGVIYQYLIEFNSICSLNASALKSLKNPEICPSCGQPVLYILGFEDEGDYYTRIHIFRNCGCRVDIGEEIFNDLIDINFYNNYIGLIDYYADLDERYHDEIGQQEIERLDNEFRFQIEDYFSRVRHHKMNCPVIHAAGVKTYIVTDQDGGGYWCYKILWCERGMKNHINDDYPC